MKPFEWSQSKNELLKSTRNISFEEIAKVIESGCLVDTIDHPNKDKYPKQRIFVVNIKNYIYLIPFVENKKRYFLKTIFPSSRYTKKLLIKK